MPKLNYFIKFLKKIYLTINRLIENNLNKLNFANFYKITKSSNFFLSLVVLIFLFSSYLLVPNIYDKALISKKLNDQLQEKFNLDFDLSQNLKYNFLPRPHFVYKNSSILKDQVEISKIEKLKIYFSLNNLFSYKNFEVTNLILEKSNFNLNNQTYDFFIQLLDSDLKDDKLIIKDSNIFYRNKDHEVLFINKILHMEYFYDNQNLQNKVVSKNKIFNLPYSLELKKNDIEKKIFSKIVLNFLKLEIKNELDFNDVIKKGLIKFTFNKNKFNATYDIKENNFIFNLFDNLENSNFFYKGDTNFNPFYSKLEGKTKKVNFSQLLNSNTLIPQLLKTEILNNKNINLNLNIYADESKNFSDFIKIYLNFKIQEGLIDIDDTRFSWRNNVAFSLENSLIHVRDGELILDGKLNLSIKNSKKIFKFLTTPKNYRVEFKNIEADFFYNFDHKVINLENIIIDNKNNKDVNETLKSLILKKNTLQNRVYLKNILNRALKFYAG